MGRGCAKAHSCVETNPASTNPLGLIVFLPSQDTRVEGKYPTVLLTRFSHSMRNTVGGRVRTQSALKLVSLCISIQEYRRRVQGF